MSTNYEVVQKQFALVERWAFEISELRAVLRDMLPYYEQGIKCGAKELWLSEDEVSTAQMHADRARQLLDPAHLAAV